MLFSTGWTWLLQSAVVRCMSSPTPPASFLLLYPINLCAVCEFGKVIAGIEVVLLVIAVRAVWLEPFTLL